MILKESIDIAIKLKKSYKVTVKKHKKIFKNIYYKTKHKKTDL